MIEMELVGVRIEMPSSQPLVLLKELRGGRHLPIWIGTPEASAIAIAQQGVIPPRPLTHDLFYQTLQALGRSISRIIISAVEDAVFYAQIVLDNGVTVSSRASDALALAQRGGSSIWCEDAVIEEAGVVISEAGESAEEEEQQMQDFMAFLDEVEPEDFEK